MQNNKPKLLIICRNSFGYQVILYNWCKRLRNHYDITYVCFDDRFHREVISLEGVVVRYVSSAGNYIHRGVRFIVESLREIDKHYDLGIIEYFPACLIFRCMRSHANLILDIRSGSVHNSKIKRIWDDWRLRLNARFYDRKIVLSEKLAQKLNLLNTHVVPLGSDIISSVRKDLSSIHLLYVGTLFNRNLIATISGFEKFYGEYKDKIDLSYTIIGHGPNKEEEELARKVQSRSMEGVVKICGYIKSENLKEYFDSCNVGVSFIPMTEYYDHQPPTKSFEYLLSGMPVIATKTSEHLGIINNKNGILIDDTIEGFYKGLKDLYTRRYDFCSERIKSTVNQFTWENIIDNNLKPFLAQVITDNGVV